MSLNFYNDYHLGDSIYSMIFLNNVIENNNIDITYFFRNRVYKSELSKINYKNIHFPEIFIDNSINTWIQANNIWNEYTNQQEGYYYYDEFYLKFYKDLAKRNNLNHTFQKIGDTLFYHPDIENRRYEDYDFFIMNSKGLSWQYKYNHQDFINFVKKLDGYKIITTTKIPGYDSTMEKKMSLLDIANLAIGCKYVIGIHTAPYATALNKKSIDTVKKWVVLNDKNINYKIKDDFLSYENILDVELDKII